MRPCLKKIFFFFFSPWKSDLGCVPWDTERGMGSSKRKRRGIVRWRGTMKVSRAVKETYLTWKNLDKLVCQISQIIYFLYPLCWSMNKKSPPATVSRVVIGSDHLGEISGTLAYRLLWMSPPWLPCHGSCSDLTVLHPLNYCDIACSAQFSSSSSQS
jgi:hypothetical protein